MIGRTATVLMVALGALHPLGSAGHHRPPRTIAPAKAAWYAAAPDPSVGPHDLLVEGLTLSTAQLPIPLPPLPPIKQVTAFTALSYQLPPGASPANLSLQLTGLSTAKLDAKLPSGAAPIACVATGKIGNGSQPITAAPAYDCTKRSAVGQLSTTGKSIVFPGIGRLLTGHTLSIVILPGSLGLERLVFKAPTKTSLSLLDFPGATSPPPPSPPPSPPTPAATAAATGSPAAGGSVPSVAVPPANAITTPTLPATTPQVASAAPTPRALVTSVKPIDDTAARTQAIGGLVALLAITAWLSYSAAGRKAVEQWGVGRFRAVRSGPPPSI
jgi:hypothetical protein